MVLPKVAKSSPTVKDCAPVPERNTPRKATGECSTRTAESDGIPVDHFVKPWAPGGRSAMLEKPDGKPSPRAYTPPSCTWKCRCGLLVPELPSRAISWPLYTFFPT